ncbi:acyltransferase [Paraburkholderia hospita]|nr:acyltransferase [Paraburkholderia hospita]
MPTAPSHANNYNLLRLCFALAVIVSHSFALLGYDEPVIWGRTLGAVSVHGFFILSGFLITDSYIRRPSVVVFSMNRALRIVPALLVALALSKIAWNLCDGFKSNPVPYIANGPIWTLTWEVICYSLVVLLGLVGVLTSANIPVVFFVGWVLYLLNLHDPSPTYAAIVPMFMMFLSGMFIRVARERVNLYAFVAPSIALLTIASSATVSGWLLSFVRENIVFLWGPHVSDLNVRNIVYLAMFPFAVSFVGGAARPLAMFKDDISYGIYVFGWPVSQTIIYISQKHNWRMDVPVLLAATLVIVIPVSWASWRLIEKPFLSLKRKAPVPAAAQQSPAVTP